MDLPIKPRVSKPRIQRRYLLIPIKRWNKNSNSYYKAIQFQWRFVCFDGNVAAIGKSWEGAYKNWVSLSIERINAINSLLVV